MRSNKFFRWTGLLSLGLGFAPATPALAGYTLTTLVTFNGNTGTGTSPGSLVADSGGNLFGIAGGVGGTFIFELPKGSTSINTVATIGSFSNPYLTIDTSGNLFGTTDFGGGAGDGTIFEVPKGSSSAITLASFASSTGYAPKAALLMDASGNLYGTTSNGGSKNEGTVFELPKGSSNITVLANCSLGEGTVQTPYSSLIADTAGNLYGTSYYGGHNSNGTIFELPKGSNTFTILTVLGGLIGANPKAGLVVDSSGDFFGTTDGGGSAGPPLGSASNSGTIFELSSGGTFTSLASFNGTNGSNPQANLVEDAAGDLFGTTYSGGTGSPADGTVFELAKGSSTITTLANFNSSNGANLNTSLIVDGAGNIFGTTQNGGPGFGFGTLFELSPTAVPEPASVAGIGLACVGLVARRRRG
jgi:uncharacterized repeat protein (TIGR03803 family)